MDENRIPQRIFHMNLGKTRLRGKPRKRWQVEMREDGRLVGGKREEEMDMLVQQRGMEKVPDNDKEPSHSAHANE